MPVIKLDLDKLIRAGFAELVCDGDGRTEKATIKENLTVQTEVPATFKYIEVFNHWNKHKGQFKRGGQKFKGHYQLTNEIKKAISQRVRDYSVEDICKAIDNYAKVLTGADYQWSYAWTLYQFLTRHNPHYRDELQIYRFLPNYFVEDDYLTDNAKRRNVSCRPAISPPVKVVTEEEKAKLREELPLSIRDTLKIRDNRNV